MKPSFYKGIVLGAAVSILVLVTSTAVAGTGIGGIFNLGQSNTVDATSALSGASVGAQLQVTNSGTGSGAQGIAAFNNSVAATLYGRNSGAGPAISGRADKKNNGVEGVSAGPGASGVYGANTSTNAMGLPGAASGPVGSASSATTPAAGWASPAYPTATTASRASAEANSQAASTARTRASAATVLPGAARVRAGSASTATTPPAAGPAYFTGGLHLGGQLDCSGCVGAGALAPGAGNRVGGYELVSASSVHDNLVRTERNIVVNCPLGKMVLRGRRLGTEGRGRQEGGTRRQLTIRLLPARRGYPGARRLVRQGRGDDDSLQHDARRGRVRDLRECQSVAAADEGARGLLPNAGACLIA